MISIQGNNKVFRMRDGSAVDVSRFDDRGFLSEEDIKHINKRIFPTLRSKIQFMDLMPVNSDIAEYEDRYEWGMDDYVADAAFIDHSTTDFNTVGGSIKKELQNIGMIGLSIPFTEKEAQASQALGLGILEKKLKVAAEAIQGKMQKVFFDGYAPLDIKGLFSHTALTATSITKETTVGATTGKKKWKEKNAQEILDELLESYNASIDATHDNIVPNTMLISTESFKFAALKKLTYNDSTPVTVLEAFSAIASKIGEVRIIPVNALNNKFKNNTNGYIFFNASMEYAEQLVPTAFKMYPLYTNTGMFYSSVCVGRYGGIVVRQPKMFTIRYGI